MLTLRLIQAGAWLLFLAAWAHMGRVDWLEQKIRNRCLVLWLKAALAAYLLAGAHSLLGRFGLAPVYLLGGYYAALAGHAAVSAAAAYLLWRLRVWPAGDVKLFVLLALLYPLMRLPGDFRGGLRFLEVLINVFVPAAAFLFLTAAAYLWRTRFAHQKEFLASLGPLKAPGFLAAKLGEARAVVRDDLARWLRDSRERPGTLALEAGAWLASMAVMAMISYALRDLVASNFLKTVFCFALFFAWSRVCQAVGRAWAYGTAFAVLAAVLARAPGVDWAALGSAFGHISVFSLFIFLGVQWAFKLVAGQSGFVFLPLLFMLPGLIPWRALARWASGGLAGVSAAASGAPELGLWAAMGLFFGLALVFVRIWDAESFRSVPPDHVAPYMTLGPALAARLEAEDFGTLYADGLMPEQVESLRDWCGRNGVTEVPLAPTISFANWIFFGYLMTLILDGHVLKLVYR